MHVKHMQRCKHQVLLAEDRSFILISLILELWKYNIIFSEKLYGILLADVFVRSKGALGHV